MANLLERLVMFIIFIFIFAIEFHVSKADVYRVGGVDGWTNVGKVDYQKWASSKNFSVGDDLVFQYNKQFHNVVRVSRQDFKACNSDKAYKIFTSGNDSFVVPSPGHFYFICSVSDHCKDGQKLDIRVLKKNAAKEAQPPAAGSIADPPISVQTPHPPPSISIPARPPATSQTTSGSTSSVYSFRCCVFVFTLISCIFLGIN